MPDLVDESVKAVDDAAAGQPSSLDPPLLGPNAMSSRQIAETVTGALVWTLLWATLLNSVLELFHTGGDLKRLLGYTVYLHLPIFALSVLVVWSVVLLTLAVTGRLWLTCALTLSVALTIGMVDREKLKVRLEPVYPSDLDFLDSPGFLVEMVGTGKLISGIALVFAVCAVVVLGGRVPSRTFRPIRRATTPRAWRNLLLARVALAIACVLFLGYVKQFNADGNRVRSAYEAAGVNWAFWYQNVNYRRNGVVPGLLYNLLSEPMVEPPDYNRETMAEISARWQAEAERVNATRSSKIDDVNVVAVLSEAFSDPTRLDGFEVLGDPLPFTRELMSRTTSGTMLAQLYGGGTANMEFETLTGQSLSMLEPQANTPYQQFVHDRAGYPSIVGFLKELGHRAVAIHPYFTAMYRRNEVYRTLGIDEFIHDSTMRQARKIERSPFISDASAFGEVEQQLTDSAEPLFVNLVTMQNHIPMDGDYDRPWPVKGLSGKTERSVGAYARGINYSDTALKNFLTALERSEEKTAVVFYGDHLPGIYPETLYDRNGDTAMKSTPFFIWTNFGRPTIETASLTSPIYFLPLLFKTMDADIPPYYALLERMYASIPAMEQGVRFDWDGDPLREDAEVRRLLRDYRLVQYDLSVGNRYAQSMFY